MQKNSVAIGTVSATTKNQNIKIHKDQQQVFKKSKEAETGLIQTKNFHFTLAKLQIQILIASQQDLEL